MDIKIGDIWKYASPLGDTHWFVYRMDDTTIHIHSIGDGQSVGYNMHLFKSAVKQRNPAWKLVSRPQKNQ